MVAIGMALILAGYTVGLYGYILIKGYNVSFKELFIAGWPPDSTPYIAGAPPGTYTGAPGQGR